MAVQPTPTPTPSPFLIEVVGGDGAPWWGVPVIAGGFLILGAVLGFFFNQLQDKRRAERERIQQWDKNLLDHASSAISLARQFISDAYDHETWMKGMAELQAEELRQGRPISPPPVEKPTIEAMMLTHAALTKEFSALQMIGPEAVRNAAVETQHYSSFVLEAMDEKEVSRAAKQLAASLEPLEAAVRRHFQVG